MGLEERRDKLRKRGSIRRPRKKGMPPPQPKLKPKPKPRPKPKSRPRRKRKDVIVSPPPKLEEMKYTRPEGWEWKSRPKIKARKDSAERTRKRVKELDKRKTKRKPISVLSHEELMEGRKRIKPKPKARPRRK